MDDRKDFMKPVERKDCNKSAKRIDGTIMFPAHHDITPENLDRAREFVKKWLKKGNKFVIVTKPHIECITDLVLAWKPWTEQVLWRFTIGSMNNSVLKFWEPNAPDFDERVDSLKFASAHSYHTSVSMEPFLDESVVATYFLVEPYVSEKIWVGKMNKIDSRVDRSTPEVEKYLDKVTTNQTDEKILSLYKTLGKHPKVEWKDSIKKVIKQYYGESPTLTNLLEVLNDRNIPKWTHKTHD